MPCNSDYMEPNEWEKNLKEVCQHLVFVYDNLPKIRKSIPNDTLKSLEDASIHCYGEPYGAADVRMLTATLCAVIRSMNKKQMKEIVFDGRNKDSRNLAAWWEEHQAADKARVIKEKEKKKLNEIKRIAFNKLTNEERAAWGITYKT